MPNWRLAIIAMLLAHLVGCADAQQPPARTLDTCSSKSSSQSSSKSSKSYVEDEESEENDLSLLLLEKVSYEGEIKGLIEEHCLSCHSKGGGNIPPMLDSWDAVYAEREAIAQEVEAREMPPGGALASRDRNLFLDWADTGFARSATQDVSGSSGGGDDEDEEYESDEEDGDVKVAGGKSSRSSSKSSSKSANSKKSSGC